MFDRSEDSRILTCYWSLHGAHVEDVWSISQGSLKLLRRSIYVKPAMNSGSDAAHEKSTPPKRVSRHDGVEPIL